MNFKLLSTVAIAALFSGNALAEKTITENDKGVAYMHSIDLGVYYTTDKSAQKTDKGEKYFIRCTNSLENVYNQKFEVTRDGLVKATGIKLSESATNHPYNGNFSVSWSNGALDINTSSYRDAYRNVNCKFGKLTINNEVIVNGKLSCKDELNVTELNTKNIRTNDITVDMNNAADYVFEDNYDLKSLNEVESYVKANKHLPGVPSAAEMAENGMSVSEMSNLLLEKVEELTLHMIELQKENQALKAKVESLEK